MVMSQVSSHVHGVGPPFLDNTIMVINRYKGMVERNSCWELVNSLTSSWTAAVASVSIFTVLSNNDHGFHNQC